MFPVALLAGILLLTNGCWPAHALSVGTGSRSSPVVPGLWDPIPDDLFDPIPPAGATLENQFFSQAMAEERTFRIHLPRSYGLKQLAQRRYPTIYLLHGDPGTPAQWDRLGAGRMADAGAAAGVLPELIVVYPDGNGHQWSAPEWEDNPFGRDKVESQLLELIAFVDRTYRTIPDRAFRAIGGLSSGGFGAANLASRHPDVFSVGMSFSGYFSAKGWVFRYAASSMRANSPALTVQVSAPARSVRYILASGLADGTYTRQTLNFAAELRSLGVAVETVYFPGGHRAENWTGGLQFGLQMIAASFQSHVPPRNPPMSPVVVSAPQRAGLGQA